MTTLREAVRALRDDFNAGRFGESQWREKVDALLAANEQAPTRVAFECALDDTERAFWDHNNYDIRLERHGKVLSLFDAASRPLPTREAMAEAIRERWRREDKRAAAEGKIRTAFADALAAADAALAMMEGR